MELMQCFAFSLTSVLRCILWAVSSEKKIVSLSSAGYRQGGQGSQRHI